mmetsp:Transcript_7041/g.23190  ORF Transcript_7041/g.23190 Transcript_7041/m.23190 type:complete len:239 (+) Transcript_7041:260-976(+)
MSFGAAVSALVLVARLATALTFRSSVRLRAISRPVTGLVTSVAHVILASRLGCARRAWRPATRRIVATRTAAGAAVARQVASSAAVVARAVIPAAHTAAHTTAHTTARKQRRRRRALSRVVPEPCAARAAIPRSRSPHRHHPTTHARSARIRVRAIPRPVSNIPTSVACIRRGCAVRARPRKVSHLTARSTRSIVRGIRRIRRISRPRRAAIVIHPFPHGVCRVSVTRVRRPKGVGAS